MAWRSVCSLLAFRHSHCRRSSCSSRSEWVAVIGGRRGTRRALRAPLALPYEEERLFSSIYLLQCFLSYSSTLV
eukprot:scaffold293081_cov33-Tisochrysis_lutea.AAC.3